MEKKIINGLTHQSKTPRELTTLLYNQLQRSSFTTQTTQDIYNHMINDD